MSSIPSFVSELVRSANETDRLSDFEAVSLLRRSITVIRDLRETVGIPADGTEHDAVIQLDRLATNVDGASREGLHRGLLEAADMVRTLWIVVDSGTRISIPASG
ncbi:hypothetical protein KX729_29650 [Rhizobium sp. XQZ8]|uniref:hypothetical protein n=1 Tax=Rhizobium populisoli TaxID=2859785 RepID=UPI001CA53924|nr:hypothetical protein [Rhizobium populisoli]MBW6425576.1 hypothetical protein [Rhizobium populisoli]